MENRRFFIHFVVSMTRSGLDDGSTWKGIGGIYIFSVATFFNIVFRLLLFSLFYLLFVHAGLMKYFNFSFVYHLYYDSGKLKRWIEFWKEIIGIWIFEFMIIEYSLTIYIYIISICLILNGSKKKSFDLKHFYTRDRNDFNKKKGGKGE